MAADLGLLSLTQLQKLSHSQQQQEQNINPNPNPSFTVGSWMWNTRRTQDEDDSWEVRAFAEDTGNIMGTTWPPRSYTCTFCRREFRSAQALGGHMNVHRRDRARLRQPSPGSANDPASSSSTSNSTLIFPSQEFVANGGLCLLYPLPNPTNVFNSTPMNGSPMESPSTLLSISPYPTNDFMSPSNFSLATSIHTSLCHPSKLEPIVDNNDDNQNEISEELDLELRLGSRPTERP